MIKRLAIHRFRGIRQGVLEDLGKVNLLIGPNNSGKTAILEMLYLGGTSGREASLILEGAPAEESVMQATTSIKYDFLGLEPLPRLRLRHGYKPTLEDNPVVINEEGGLEVDLKTLISGSRIPLFRLGAPLEEWGSKKPLKFFKKDIGRVALFSVLRREKNESRKDEQKNNEYEQKIIPAALVPSFFEQNDWIEETCWHYVWDPAWVYGWDKKEFIDHFAIWAEEGIPPHAERVLLFDFHTANDHFQEKFAQWAKDNIPDWYEKISTILAQVFPALKDASIEVDNAPGAQKKESGYLRFPGTGSTRLVVDQFGDGARHAFKVLASLIALAEVVDEEHPGLFLWEDPELFMHPESLDRLLNELLGLILDKPIQVFLSSQSLEVVAFMTRHFETSFIEAQDALRAFRLELDAGRLYAATYHFENLRTWLKQGMDPRFWGVANLPFSYRYQDEKEHLSEEEM